VVPEDNSTQRRGQEPQHRENLVDVVVEVDVASAEVTAEHGGVSREDCSDIDVASATHDQTNTGNPLMEVCH